MESTQATGFFVFCFWKTKAKVRMLVLKLETMRISYVSPVLVLPLGLRVQSGVTSNRCKMAAQRLRPSKVMMNLRGPSRVQQACSLKTMHIVHPACFKQSICSINNSRLGGTSLGQGQAAAACTPKAQVTASFTVLTSTQAYPMTVLSIVTEFHQADSLMLGNTLQKYGQQPQARKLLGEIPKQKNKCRDGQEK